MKTASGPIKPNVNSESRKYIGHTLHADGLRPDGEKICAITQVPTPDNKRALMCFKGMVQYLAKIIPNLSEISALLRNLLQVDTEKNWQESQQSRFQVLKRLITEAPTLKFYELNKPVSLSVDASKDGIGAVILQDGRPVVYGSRALTDC